MLRLKSDLHPAMLRYLAASSCLLVSLVGSMNVLAQDIGVPSANPADNPPQVTVDPSTRSTDPDRPPAYGPEDAKVLVIVFSDYQCPSCRRSNQATHQIAAEFPGEVRLELWHHPLSSHPAAEIAAVAAVAAQRQGRFWEMHDKIFANRTRLDSARLEQLAQEIGLDMDQYRSDFKDPSALERVRRESEVAVALGAPNTPGFVINGKVSQGWASWGVFKMRVGQEVDAATALAEQGMDPVEIRNQRAIDNNSDSETYQTYRNAVLLPGAAVAPE